MKTKAMGIFALLIIVLSVAGFAYAHWSDTVQIEGTVHMGDFLVGWLDIKDCWDNDLDWDVPKEVADIDCKLESPEASVHHEPAVTVYHKLVVEITNAYPQYQAWCKVDLKNAGTTPAHIIAITMTPGPTLVISDTWNDANGNPIGWQLDDATTLLPVLNIELYKQETGLSLVCNQIDPCQDEPVDLWLEVKQDGAEQCHTYTFSFEIEAIQWNKVP